MFWKDLKVWQESHGLVLDIYRISGKFPKSELYGLADQLKRAASSVPANIVEGQSRNTTKEYLQFLFNARGSLEEARYFLLLVKDLNFLAVDEYNSLEEKCSKTSVMLNNLIKSLKSTQEERSVKK